AATVTGPDPDPDSDLLKRLIAPTPDVTIPIRLLFEEVLIPAIVPAAEALEPLARDADLFLSHIIQLAAPAVAARTGVRWASATGAITCYPSGQSPPTGVALRGLPSALCRLPWAIARRVFRDLDAPAAAAYRRLGVPPLPNIALGGAYSRRLTLGLWSPAFFPRPSDWPAWLQVGGYARWDASGPSSPARPELGAGGPLIVFTLGSSVVNDPREFYEAALEAIAPTDWRAVLLGAPDTLPVPPSLAGRVAAVRYAPYADLFPLADAIVHQGGAGTTQAACYYGIPNIVVPRGFDQWENAAHIQRNGWGLRLQPQDFSSHALRLRLERLLGDADIHARVAALGEKMRAEPGPARSADLLEAALEP
ncbi:MAG: glycosyltransferase family 1 protein, partial [Armatimonadetes bacterium]|nr:glycosyltransferase family 1 protein [Armatimonadota bacterium]